MNVLGTIVSHRGFSKESIYGTKWYGVDRLILNICSRERGEYYVNSDTGKRNTDRSAKDI